MKLLLIVCSQAKSLNEKSFEGVYAKQMKNFTNLKTDNRTSVTFLQKQNFASRLEVSAR